MKRRNHFRVSEHFDLDDFEDPTTATVMLCDDLPTYLEAVQERFGHNIRISSGYRTPAHNSTIGGAPTSYHLVGGAADLVPVTGRMDDLAAAANMIHDLYVINEGDHVHVHLRRLMPPS